MKRIIPSSILAGLFALLAISIQSSAQSPAHVTISGQVFDRATGLPLPDANVFIANTLLGAATDTNGYFKIKRVSLGAYELVVSRIGYEVQKTHLRLTVPVDQSFNFNLKPIVLPAPEIVVSAAEEKKWKKNLKKFAELFLGTSQNASECRILNPEVLDFEEEQGSRPFAATASQPLKIENQALGYRIHVIFEDFSAKDEEVKYLFHAGFEELPAQNPKEKKKWEENRLKAYRGSLQHFLAALAANRFQQEGFKVYRTLAPIQNDASPHRIEVDQPDFLFPGELSFERRLHFRNCLEVTYLKEKEEYGYVEVRVQRDLSLLGASSRILAQAREPQPQTSWIALRQSEAMMDILGYVYDPLAVTTFGYWAWERLAEKLPWEYSPHGAYLPEQPAGIADRDYYEEGIRLKTSGDWQRALDAWLQGKEVLAAPGESDPRIGIAFIELTVEQAATAYYEQACDLYDWGFSRADSKRFTSEIATEIERIAPILAEDEYKAWRADLEKGERALNAKIRNFWIEKDPTPATKTNERLLEHWERIAYARRNFKKASNTIYGTDDRGLIYVKYGEPDRKKSVQLGTRMDELYGLLEIYNLAATQSRQSAAVSEIRRGLGAYLTFPECELWAYHSLQPEKPVIYVFGQKAGRGAYGLRNGVEEFIPEEAFRRASLNSRFTGGILPGALMQIMYYNDLAVFDNVFAGRYEELKTIWFRSSSSGNFPNYNIVRSVREKYKITDAENPARRFAPVDQSDLEKTIPPIQLVSYPARFLDENNEPQLVFIAFAFPPGFGQAKPARLDEAATPGYRLCYALIARDDGMDEIQRASANSLAENDHTAVLTMPHQKTQAHYTLAVEAFTQQPQKETGKPIGAGKDFFEKITPLDSNPQQLEVSDLVIGVEPPAGFEVGLLPYPVVPSRQIRKPDALKVYLEIYHLHLDDGGAGHFNMDFRVVKLERKGKKIVRAEMIASAFDFQSAAPAAKESFTISVANLKAGDYGLEVEVQDKISGMRKKRSAAFQIAKERQG